MTMNKYLMNLLYMDVNKYIIDYNNTMNNEYNNTLIIKTINTQECHFDYGYYEYKYNLINPSIEIQRIEFLEKNKINPDNVVDNITHNKNTLDIMIPDNLFYEFKPSLKIKNVNKLINNNEVIFSLNDTKLTINYNVYLKMINKLNKTTLTDIEKDNLIFSIFIRYKYVNMLSNIQLAVPEHIYEYYMNKKNARVELFGSAINHTLPYFCSLFYDLEKYFGSVGNHFNLNIYRGTYLLNPPFVQYIMDKSIKRVMNMMNINKFIVYIFIPVWDISGRDFINKTCKIKVKTNNLDWKLINELDNFKFMKKKEIYCKENFYYFDYINFKKINATPTYKYVLDSTIIIDKIKKQSVKQKIMI
jgi:hypothetical protein